MECDDQCSLGAPMTNPMKKPVISAPSAGRLMVHLVSCPRNKHIFRCDQNGPSARRCRRSVLALLFRKRAKRGRFAYTSQPPWAAASWLLFGVARSSRPAPVLRWRHRCRSAGVQNWCGMLVATASPARIALKNSQLTDGGMPPTYDSMH